MGNRKQDIIEHINFSITRLTVPELKELSSFILLGLRPKMNRMKLWEKGLKKLKNKEITLEQLPSRHINW